MKYLEHRIFMTSEMCQYLLTPVCVYTCVKCYLYLDILVIFVKNFLVMINLCLCWWICLPGVGLWPKIPLYIAGTRIEPPKSEAIPITDAPEATSAAFKKICLKELVECYISEAFSLLINMACKEYFYIIYHTKLSIM